jgi:hypothetical protein
LLTVLNLAFISSCFIESQRLFPYIIMSSTNRKSDFFLIYIFYTWCNMPAIPIQHSGGWGWGIVNLSTTWATKEIKLAKRNIVEAPCFMKEKKKKNTYPNIKGISLSQREPQNSKREDDHRHTNLSLYDITITSVEARTRKLTCRGPPKLTFYY